MSDIKILLVEDESVEAMELKRTLEFLGYEVPYIASDSEEAVNKALEIMPGLVLMDIILKGDSDGIEAASKIKKLNIPLIYLTAHSEEPTIERVKLTEPYGYIIKPYNINELKYTIELALYKNQMEKVLKESEKNYRELVNNSMVAIYKTNLKGDILFANYAMVELFDFESIEALKTKTALQIYKNPKDRKKLIQKLQKTGRFRHQKVEMVSKCGETITILLSAHLEDNIISGMMMDITEQNKAKNELLESEDFLKNIVENIPNMIFIKSADKLNFEMVNKAGEELMGHSREELIGKTDYDFFPKKEADFFTQKDREVLQNKKLVDILEETIETKDLGQRILHTKKIPILDKEGNPQYLLGVSEDVTELKQGEIKIRKSLDEKETLLREIHHRVKNNLQIIASLLHLQESTVNDGELENILKESESRVKSMAIVYDKLYQSPNFTDINFKKYIEKLVYDILYTYGIKKGTIKAQMDIEDILLNIDTAIPLGLIINELITNSVKYAFPQKKGTITIQLKSLPEKMEITIADDGIGIPEDINLENPETLGLQLVKNLVRQIDGEIELDRNHGTEFKIKFKELEYKERI
ncbi:histidine kinase dimerization/phosphoacceptor domain -containing protein [Methanobacterium sp. SMA-27]|uniref:histidine kinase dimerization/phosphoacceptor domain -containing protein n=1 Tax=Methanobacterium sp. SMA-27 TaxID=1495336 RepID=UPI00064FC4AE|nr:histidine kinase dimerization/phosphoacceptor domain -containing protein [Methanobacterium sp. SMA-27]